MCMCLNGGEEQEGEGSGRPEVDTGLVGKIKE